MPPIVRPSFTVTLLPPTTWKSPLTVTPSNVTFPMPAPAWVVMVPPTMVPPDARVLVPSTLIAPLFVSVSGI